MASQHCAGPEKEGKGGHLAPWPPPPIPACPSMSLGLVGARPSAEGQASVGSLSEGRQKRCTIQELSGAAVYRPHVRKRVGSWSLRPLGEAQLSDTQGWLFLSPKKNNVQKLGFQNLSVA